VIEETVSKFVEKYSVEFAFLEYSDCVMSFDDFHRSEFETLLFQ
jgi:hypothetical protein